MASKQKTEQKPEPTPLQLATAAIAQATAWVDAGTADSAALRELAFTLPDGDPASGARVVLLTCAERPDDAAGLLKAQAEHLAWLGDHAKQVQTGG